MLLSTFTLYNFYFPAFAMSIYAFLRLAIIIVRVFWGEKKNFLIKKIPCLVNVNHKTIDECIKKIVFLLNSRRANVFSHNDYIKLDYQTTITIIDQVCSRFFSFLL
jgi:hypothetical protein